MPTGRAATTTATSRFVIFTHSVGMMVWFVWSRPEDMRRESRPALIALVMWSGVAAGVRLRFAVSLRLLRFSRRLLTCKLWPLREHRSRYAPFLLLWGVGIMAVVLGMENFQICLKGSAHRRRLTLLYVYTLLSAGPPQGHLLSFFLFQTHVGLDP